MLPTCPAGYLGMRANSRNPFHYSFPKQNQSYHHMVNVLSEKTLQMQETEVLCFVFLMYLNNGET